MDYRARPIDDSPTFLLMLLAGPTYSIDELTPTCTLLSRRFTGELWAFGSYEHDATIGRIRLRVIKERSALRAINLSRFGWAILGRARELHRARPAEIVVTSYDPFLSGWLALRAARILKAPFVCEVNGVYGSVDNLAHVASPLLQRLRRMRMRLLGSYVLRRADAVRLLFAEQLAGFVTLRPETVVRRFFALCNTERFSPGREEAVILAAGFPFMIKGIDVLVSAFRRIAPRFPGWRLVLIGHRIPEDLHARGLEGPAIEAHPGLTQAELARWVSHCSILVLASRSEAMGRILIEAAVAAKCRVASRVGGIPSVIADGQDGVLVEKEDVPGLAAVLERLMGDGEARRRLGQAAAARAAREFTPAIYLEHFSELIRAALAAAPAHRECT